MSDVEYARALNEHLSAYGADSCAVFQSGSGRFSLVVSRADYGTVKAIGLDHFSSYLKRRSAELYRLMDRVEVTDVGNDFQDWVSRYENLFGYWLLWRVDADLAGGATGCCEDGGVKDEPRLATEAEVVAGVNADLADGSDYVEKVTAGGIEVFSTLVESEKGGVENPKISKNEGLGSKILKVVSAVSSAPSAPRGEALRWDGDNLDAMREFSGVLAIDRGEPMGDCLMVPNGGGSINWGLFNPGCYAIWLEGAKRVRFMDSEVFAEEFNVVNEPSEKKISKDSAPAEIRLEGPVTITTPDGVSAEYSDGMNLDDMVKSGIAKVPAEPKSELFPMTGDFEKDFETAGNMLGPVEVKNEPLFQSDTSSLVSGIREEGGTIPQYKGVSAVHPELYEFSCMIGSHIAAWGAEKWRVIQIKKDCFFIILLNKEHNSFLTYISKSSKELFEKISSCANNVNAADYEASIEYAADKYPGCPFSDGYRDEVSANTTTGTKEQLLHYEASQKKQDLVCGEVYQKTRAAADVLGPWLVENGATHYRIYELPDKKLAVIALIPCWDTGKSKFDDAIRAANGVVAWMISGTFMAHEKTGYIIGLKRHANYPYIDYVRSGEIAFEHTGTAEHGTDALRMAIAAKTEAGPGFYIPAHPESFAGRMERYERVGKISGHGPVSIKEALRQNEPGPLPSDSFEKYVKRIPEKIAEASGRTPEMELLARIHKHASGIYGFSFHEDMPAITFPDSAIEALRASGLYKEWIEDLWRESSRPKEKQVHQEIVFNGFEYEYHEINRLLKKVGGVQWEDNGLTSKIWLPDNQSVLNVGDCLVIYSDNTFEVKSA